MSDNKQNGKQYSATDIQRYLKGEMSAEEMHAIETAALDDPFLADAIEGFEIAMTEGKEESMKVGLEELNKQFSDRIKQPAKIVSMNRARWWQISAAAIVLVIISVAVYNNRTNQEHPSDSKLAVVEKQRGDTSRLKKPAEDKASSLSAFSDSQKNQDKKPVIPPAANVSTKKTSTHIDGKTSSQTHNKSQKAKNALPEEKPIAKNDDIVGITTYNQEKEETSDKPAVTDSLTRRSQPDIASAPIEGFAKRNNQFSGQLNSFSGKVVDQNNKPLPNASVQIVQSKTNLITDQSGNFNFATKDSVVDVQIGLVGFEQRNFRLQNNIAPNQLVLEPIKANLEEVVVIGYGTQRKKDLSSITGKVQNAIPEIGWIEYEKYLEKNKKPPANNPFMKGEVVVSFQVKGPALLSDFKIEKSLSKDYDAEAIRLIQEGPAWKLLNGRKTRITVIVKF